MLITILEVVGLLAVIVMPLAGPSKKKKNNTLIVDTDVSNAHYAVNEDGDLIEIHLSSHAH